MTGRRAVAAVALALVLGACRSGQAPAPVDGRLPVSDPTTGQIVGEVVEVEANRVAREGGRAEVRDGDRLVGHLTSSGFVPLRDEP